MIQPLKFFENNNITPRKLQVDILEKVTDNWNKYKYIILNLPVGVGKTYIATSLASSVGSTYILTSTLQLQNQYEESWKSLVNLKGRGNYQCNINTNFTVEAAPCSVSPELFSNCMSNKICAYYNQKERALSAQSMITNPMYFLYSTHCGFISENAMEDNPWKKRDLLVIDETHNLETHLIAFAESTLKPTLLHSEFGVACSHILFNNNFVDNYKALEELNMLVTERCGYFKAQLDETFEKTNQSSDQLRKWAKGFNDRDAEKVKKINVKLYALDKVLQSIKIFFDTHSSIEELNSRWIMHENLDENSITLSPLYGNFLFHEYLTRTADKFVFLSATTGSKNAFCKELGIPENECLYIETGTPFPPEKSPILVFPHLKLGYKDLNTTLPKIGPLLNEILDAHKNDKGIIHSSTYNLANEIVNRVSKNNKDRLVYRDKYVNGKTNYKLNNEAMLKEHAITDNSILVSPSMMEGVDLKDDLSAFQIIMKFPWASLGDPRVKKKSELDSQWYSNKAWISIQQASGRSTRHENDESVTYILDASFPYFYNLWKHNLPSWFKDRLVFDNR